MDNFQVSFSLLYLSIPIVLQNAMGILIAMSHGERIMVRLFILFIGLFFTVSVLAKMPPTSPTEKSTAPPNCAVWFDGCNQCRVGVNPKTGQQILACTRKYCPQSSLKPAKCLKQKTHIIETKKHPKHQRYAQAEK